MHEAAFALARKTPVPLLIKLRKILTDAIENDISFSDFQLLMKTNTINNEERKHD